MQPIFISLYKYTVFSMRIIALSWYNFLLMDKYSGIFLPKLFKYSNWVEEIAEWLWSFLHEHKALWLNHKDTCKKLGWFMKQPVDPKLHVSYKRRVDFTGCQTTSSSVGNLSQGNPGESGKVWHLPSSRLCTPSPAHMFLYITPIPCNLTYTNKIKS